MFNNNINVNEAIKELLKDIIIGIDDSLGIISIVLIGSAARREETYSKINNEIKLLSDIEFIVVIKKNSNVKKIIEVIDKNISKIHDDNNSELFHIDYSIYYENKLKCIDKRFINYETKYCGQVFWGNSRVLEKIPDITINNLNYSELQTVLIHRMYSVYKYLKILKDEQEKTYILARNMLDVITIILPYIKILLPTYGYRVHFFINVMQKEYIENFFKVDELIESIKNCYLIKKSPDFIIENNIKLDDMYYKFVSNIQSLYNFMKHKNSKTIFNVDRRGILRALLSVSFKKLIKEIRKPKMLDELYIELIRCLILKDFKSSDNIIKEKMKYLFNYC